MTEDEYLNSIRGRTYDYPIVLRTADPLLIRVNKTSLLVDNTNFFAKVKCGLAYNGYYIYSSGLGTPIAEVDLGKESITQQIMPDGTVVNKNQAWSDSTIAGKAEEFLNHLEARIYIMPSTNAIKEAIDRFCWQMHYDVTKTTRITPPEYFAENIVIDRVDPSGQIPDAQHPESQIETFKGYTMYDCVYSYIEPSINKVATNIKADGDTYTLSKALRDDITTLPNNTHSYSIAIALRQDSQKSVSNAVHDQTELEAEQFDDISNNKLGAFGSGGEGASAYVHKTLYGAVGDYAQSNDTGLTITNGIELTSGKLGAFDGNPTSTNTVFTKLDSVGTDANSAKTASESADGKLGNFNPSANPSDTVASRIGTSNDTSDTTVFGKIYGTNTKLGSFKTTSGSGNPTDDSLYDVLVGANGVIRKSVGYQYASDHYDPLQINNWQQYNKYYVNTEISRFAIAYSGQGHNRPNQETGYGNPYYNGLRIYSQGDVT